ETLDRLGGAVGAGTTFLEETFSAPTAPPEHRLHEEAARAVLTTLLPGPGAEIKGHRRSRTELLEASGYTHTPEDFRALMRILDGRTRLLTPIALEGRDSNDSSRTTPDAERFYQLTHDYLVPSIRDWLERKKNESRQGRAELRLSERSALWGAKPEPKQLPSLLEWLDILSVTSRQKWTAAERRVMIAARKRHLTHTGVVLFVLLVLGLVTQQLFERSAREQQATHAGELIQRLNTARIDQVPDIVDEIDDDRTYVNPLLKTALRSLESNPPSDLHVRLALLPDDPEGQVNPLYDRLLNADPEPFRVILKALRPHWSKFTSRLWDELKPSSRDPNRRFRAAVALANYAPESDLWDGHISEVTERLVVQPALHVPHWVEALRPLKARLIPSLTTFYRDHAPSHEIARQVTAQILADYASDLPDKLTDALAESPPNTFPIIFEALRKHEAEAIMALESAFARATEQRGADTSDAEASRAANLAIALFRMGRSDQLWPLLKGSPTPRTRSFLIDRLGPMGANPGALADRALTETDDTIHEALLLSLGGFDREAFPPALRRQLDERLPTLFRNHRNAPVHAASGRLLRLWKENTKVHEIEHALGSGNPERGRQWYVNRLDQTFVVLSGPVEFVMGSRPDGFEALARSTSEGPQKVRIPRGYDIAATEVTVSQFLPFLDHEPDLRKPFTRSLENTPDRPITTVTWFEAARYCNWLSQQEGIPSDEWCYEPDDGGGFGPGMHLAPDYLKRTGYRLPTEAEWEYACRAGSILSRCYGDSDELLDRYANHAQPSQTPPRPVGSLLPNAFGLFDMHGNVAEWCQENSGHHSMDPPSEDVWVDVEDALEVTANLRRIIRGGALHHLPRTVRSSQRFNDPPDQRERVAGFRLARSHRP
ncbi:SUMF1/EgtB/PvdO family nonheme iron enzyme, partial [Singulisphaera rosea]